ncbi:conserved hypothetical protein [Streptomyces viridochromogenes DSM 40736]|uniref:SAF domain-containing protein n=1 Tax=Streptomyces viridochromogenes (strain DSM 40736 / JCM 4977 / BCRC 1201 / Tue 494) TaxID=591159 RepID=D9X742_STRVT|nr:hypothetical protein [Streptomyces viridochromogenes]EFL34109.1 conserved hypothetical protein [Streptomyces viridochromogenes DSM 40736]
MKIQERTGAGAGRSAAPAQPSVGDRLPTPPRERKPALAALAVLLILVGALGATMLVLQAGERIEVVKVTKDVQAGESLEDSDVTSVMVAKDDAIHYIEWSQLKTIQTYKAKSTIYKGTLAVGEMFAKTASLPAGKASVGLALKEGTYPADIKSGDVVSAYRVSTTGSSSNNSDSDTGSGGTSTSGSGAIVENARVNNVNEDDDATVSTGNLSLTLLVDEADAAALASAAAANQVAIVHVPGN